MRIRIGGYIAVALLSACSARPIDGDSANDSSGTVSEPLPIICAYAFTQPTVSGTDDGDPGPVMCEPDLGQRGRWWIYIDGAEQETMTFDVVGSSAGDAIDVRITNGLGAVCDNAGVLMAALPHWRVDLDLECAGRRIVGEVGAP